MAAQKEVLVDRDMLERHWNEAWQEGLWAAPWSRVLEGLAPGQATWRPGPARRCIWEYVNHMLFWREVALRALEGEQVSADEQQRRNFEWPESTDEAALEELRRQWERSWREIGAAIADDRHTLDRLQYVPYHDSYHIGQIMLLRALQGMKPIE